MGKVFGIDLGTTYSCIAYMDENGKPVVLKNSEGDLTTPSAVYFESQTDVTVGSVAKESAKMAPDQVVTFIKRNIGQPGFSLTINGVEMKPEEISSYILKKVVNDAVDTLKTEGKLGDDEEIKDVVITCPAYFGVTERDATEAAGKIAGLNVLAIINEPTAAAISYGVVNAEENKTVLVYDLGGGTFDVTMINIKPGEIRVVCTGGDHNLGGKDWDDRVLLYLADMYQTETGTPDNILEDAETLQELYLASERAKKLLTAKEKAPVSVNYNGERARIELTREKFDELTEDLLTRTIDLTRDMFKEAEKKGFKQSDVSEIILVGGSSKMPQVMKRVQAEFGIETKMFDPDESVAKGAAIYAQNTSAYNAVIDEIARNTGKTAEEVKDEIDTGKTTVEQAAKEANVQTGKGARRLPGEEMKIVNVSSRSFGTQAYDENDQLKLYNIIIRNAELPAIATDSFYPRYDNQRSVKFEVMECLASDPVVDVDLGKEIGQAELELPAGVTRDTAIEVTFKLNESGLLELKARETKGGRIVEASFQTTSALTEEELGAAIRRSKNSNVN
ncbi:MAG: Hsp70 family protein [Clostridia bacterium]|nr:Hsp70 family protein [Clostridia bacterium]